MSRRRGKACRGEYDVGYGKPPRRTQFQAGQSGNPKGRPKKWPSISEVFAREATRHVRVRQGDQIEAISKLEAVVRKILQRAMEGDLGAARLVMLVASALEKAEANNGTEKDAVGLGFGTELPNEDALRRMIARLDHLLPSKRRTDDRD